MLPSKNHGGDCSVQSWGRGWDPGLDAEIRGFRGEQPICGYS